MVSMKVIIADFSQVIQVQLIRTCYELYNLVIFQVLRLNLNQFKFNLSHISVP